MSRRSGLPVVEIAHAETGLLRALTDTCFLDGDRMSLPVPLSDKFRSRYMFRSGPSIVAAPISTCIVLESQCERLAHLAHSPRLLGC
jgi:hypothetical protein